MNKTTLLFYANVHKQSSKGKKEIPIYMRITNLGTKAEAKLKIGISEKELPKWNTTLERLEVKGSNRLNDHLNKIKTKFDDLLISEQEWLNECHAREIKVKLIGISSKKKKQSIYDYFFEHFKKNIAGSSKYSLGTQKSYLKSLRHVANFDREMSKKHFMSELNVDYAEAFTNYLLKDKSDGKKGMSEVSASTVIKNLKKIINDAVNKGRLNSNPFSKISLKKESAPKPFTNLEYLETLMNTELLKPTERVIADLFLFMSLTGCAYQDAQDLNNSMISKRDKGMLLTYSRNKTTHISKQYLTDQAEKMLERMKPFTAHNDLTYQVSLGHFNRTLKMISARLGFDVDLTTHSARRAFSQLNSEAGMDGGLIEDTIMGWSSGKKIASRYKTVSDAKLVEARNNLQQYLVKLGCA